MSRQSFSHLGSGTIVYTTPLPSGTPTPHASEGDVLFGRDGDNVILLNPEDFSVYRNGTTRLVALTANVVTRLDTTLENRRAVAIANTDSTAILYIGFHNAITAVPGNTGGFPIFPKGSISINCSNRLHIYGVSVANITVGIMEVA